MKKKVDAVIEERLIIEAEEKASEQKLTLSQVFEEALRSYLTNKNKNFEESVTLATKGSMRISSEQLKVVMEEKSYYDNR